MIKLTRLNHSPLILNSDLIEHIEVTPDTVIKLTNGQKLIVLESADEVVDKVITFRKSLFSNNPCCRLISPIHHHDETGEAESRAHGG